MDFEAFLNSLLNWAMTTGMKIIIAIVILIVSFRVITLLSRKIGKKLTNGKKPLDKTITTTLAYVISITLKTLVVIALIGYLGIDTSGFAALITSLGVGIGLAVNGALSNLAGGALLIITRPFRVDDFIEASGYSGTVEDIHIVTTRLRTPDNKVVYIPNGTLSSGTIVNYSEKDIRRVDLQFSVGYNTGSELAKSIILELARSHGKVLREPEPFVRVSDHAESGIKILARVWTKSADYWDVNFDLIESVKAEFDKHGIRIPYNQIDVHVKND